MNAEVKLCTTKPDSGEAEYGIWDSDTQTWVRHGIVIPVAIESLTPEQQGVIAGARAIMLSAATAHAIAQGYIPAP